MLGTLPSMMWLSLPTPYVWTVQRRFLLKNTVGIKEKGGNFTVQKPDKRYLSQEMKVNIMSDKSYRSYEILMRCDDIFTLFLWSFSPELIAPVYT